MCLREDVEGGGSSRCRRWEGWRGTSCSWSRVTVEPHGGPALDGALGDQRLDQGDQHRSPKEREEQAQRPGSCGELPACNR